MSEVVQGPTPQPPMQPIQVAAAALRAIEQQLNTYAMAANHFRALCAVLCKRQGGSLIVPERELKHIEGVEFQVQQGQDGRGENVITLRILPPKNKIILAGPGSIPPVPQKGV